MVTLFNYVNLAFCVRFINNGISKYTHVHNIISWIRYDQGNPFNTRLKKQRKH